MNEKRYDFDMPISRAGSFSEKYDGVAKYFGASDLEPFWVADMDFASPEFLVNALKSRLEHPLFGYTIQYDKLCEAICLWMQSQHEVSLSRESILFSPSVVTSIVNVIAACTSVDDQVIVMSPVYGPFLTQTASWNRKVVDVALQAGNGQFEIDWASFENAVADSKTKLLLLCNPHNPGGRVWSESELNRLIELCEKHDVIIFSDEIHCDIVYPPNRHMSLLNLTKPDSKVAVAHSIGKTFNTSGLKASFLMISNPVLRKAVFDQACKTHTEDINIFGKVAIETLLSPEGAIYKQQLVQYLSESVSTVYEKLSASGLSPILPQATFLVWCDFSSKGEWQEVFRILTKEAKVALSGGTFFGESGKGWFRINCAHPRSKLYAAVDRIIEILKRH